MEFMGLVASRFGGLVAIVVTVTKERGRRAGAMEEVRVGSGRKWGSQSREARTRRE